jgi:hypothetical protein
MNIDDGDIFLGEFENGALLGADELRHRRRYPGIEARVYGSASADLSPRRGGRHLRTLRAATRTRSSCELEIPARCYPPGGGRQESWRTSSTPT